MDDGALLKAVGEGDAAWVAVSLRRAIPDHAVEDVLEGTFIAVWRGAKTYGDEGAVGGWIWGIARRKAAMWARSKRRPHVSLDEATADSAENDDVEAAAVRGADLATAMAALGPAGGEGQELVRLACVEDRLWTPSGIQMIRCTSRSVPNAGRSRPPTRVAADAWAEPAGRVERLAAVVVRSPGLARALVTTPSLIASWIGATVVVLIVGAIATRSTGEPWVVLLAPTLAGIVPSTWGAIAFLAAMPDSTAGWWAWPVCPADQAGAFVAALVAVVGLFIAGVKGTRDEYVVAAGIVE